MSRMVGWLLVPIAFLPLVAMRAVDATRLVAAPPAGIRQIPPRGSLPEVVADLPSYHFSCLSPCLCVSRERSERVVNLFPPISPAPAAAPGFPAWPGRG